MGGEFLSVDDVRDKASMVVRVGRAQIDEPCIATR